ncbi:3-beta hydroxysteroid dehydrogenase [Smithella sp. F21]|nr:3-beta hydroxysteroid dehydrogenase [Smithella sp. F21]
MYIIFGGSGFIGSHMLRYLRNKRAKEIVVADIAENNHPRYPGVIYKKCDVREKIPSDLISDPDVVINFAAVHRTPGHEDHEYFDTNVKGARNVADFCERTGCNTLWFTSSISVYGPSEEPMYETSALNPESAYGMSKQQAEAIHREWQEKDPRRKLVVARPAVVFGARENGNFTRLAKALKRGFFVFPGRSDTIKGCGYVEDLIGSFFFMQEQPDPFILFNYCYPKPYTIEDICEAFVKVANLHRPLGTVPLSLMVNVARVFQLLDKLGFKNGIHPERMYKLIRSTHIVPDELMKRGYPYQTDIEEGLRRWLADEPKGEFV